MASETRTLDAVILAGGINKIPLYPGYKPGYKALLPFAGKPAIQYTLDALRDVSAVGRILVVGPEAQLRDALAASHCSIECEYVPGGDSSMASVQNALAYLKESERVLFTTADLPLVTAANIQAFLDACAKVASPYPVNMYLSTVLRRSFIGPFAKSRKGHMIFREGAVYHGNLALIEPHVFDTPGLARVMARLYRRRGNPLGSALAGGWRIALSYSVGAYLLRILSTEQMAAIASRRLGVGIIPVRVDSPEIAIDVDKPGDYELVQRELEARTIAS